MNFYPKTVRSTYLYIFKKYMHANKKRSTKSKNPFQKF